MQRTIIIVIGILAALLTAAGITYYAPYINMYRYQIAIEIDSYKTKKIISELTLMNHPEAYNVLLVSLENRHDDNFYWELLNGISRFTDKTALDNTASFIIAHKDEATGPDLLWMMHNNRTPTVLPLLKNVLNNGSYEMQLECLRQISLIPCRESLDIIFDFLKTRPLDYKISDNRDILRESIRSLKKITHVDRGNYPEAWMQWWEENKGNDISKLIRSPNSHPNPDIIKCR